MTFDAPRPAPGLSPVGVCPPTQRQNTGSHWSGPAGSSSTTLTMPAGQPSAATVGATVSAMCRKLSIPLPLKPRPGGTAEIAVRGVPRAGAVQLAVAQDHVVRDLPGRVLHRDHALDGARAGSGGLAQRHRLVGQAVAVGVEPRDALGDQALHAVSAHRVDEVAGADDAQFSVGLEVDGGQVGELMDHRVGARLGDRVLHRREVECVHPDDGGTGVVQFGTGVRIARGADHGVALRDQFPGQRQSDDAPGAGDEDPHVDEPRKLTASTPVSRPIRDRPITRPAVPPAPDPPLPSGPRVPRSAPPSSPRPRAGVGVAIANDVGGQLVRPHCALFFGEVACCGQLCQKQPST